MSTFEVCAVEIDDVSNHPDADRLSIVKIGGYNCISAKLDDGSHRYNKGDIAIYIPSSSILPDWLLKKLGMWRTDCVPEKGSLSGTNGNRVKAIKLRGVISEGILYSVEDTRLYDEDKFFIVRNETEALMSNLSASTDFSEFLGITKYEPVIPQQLSGQIIGDYNLAFNYDIENYLKFKKVFTPNDDVVALEKCHGSFCAIGFTKDKGKEGQISLNDTLDVYVSSKGLLKQGLILKINEANANNVYVKTALELISNPQFAKLDRECIVMGEVFGKGIQDLTYGFDTPTFRMFDWFDKETNSFMDDSALEILGFTYGVLRVPVLYRGKFDHDTMDKLRSGKTTYATNHIREGIVIRSTTEEKSDIRGLHQGRKQLKYISDEYLLRKNGTEYQ